MFMHWTLQYGDIHKWTDYDRSTVMQSKLTGLAKSWYHQLERYDYTWAQWKVHRREPFPRRHDFAVMLEEMLEKCKIAGEAMTAYYHAKLTLSGRVDVNGEHAMSCIIRGLPEELRSNAHAGGCPTPEALYQQFSMGLDFYSGDHFRHTSDGVRGDSRAAKRTVSTGRTSIRCYNCQEQGSHLSRDCPKVRMNRCWNCGVGSHLAKACPKRRLQGVGASDRDEFNYYTH